MVHDKHRRLTTKCGMRILSQGVRSEFRDRTAGFCSERLGTRGCGLRSSARGLELIVGDCNNHICSIHSRLCDMKHDAAKMGTPSPMTLSPHCRKALGWAYTLVVCSQTQKVGSEPRLRPAQKCHCQCIRPAKHKK